MKAEDGQQKIDAVKLMRQIRDKLSQRYLKDPTAEEEDLARVRDKYGIKIKENE